MVGAFLPGQAQPEQIIAAGLRQRNGFDLTGIAQSIAAELKPFTEADISR